jgi:hypothetical protein
VWWYDLTIPELGNWREEDREFKASLNRETLSPKNKNK